MLGRWLLNCHYKVANILISASGPLANEIGEHPNCQLSANEVLGKSPNEQISTNYLPGSKEGKWCIITIQWFKNFNFLPAKAPVSESIIEASWNCGLPHDPKPMSSYDGVRVGRWRGQRGAMACPIKYHEMQTQIKYSTPDKITKGGFPNC